MAAGTNWKRPWEEDADGSSDRSTSVVPPSRRSSASSYHAAISEARHISTDAPKAPLPPLFRSSESFTSVNINQHTRLGIRDINQADGQPQHQASLTATHKRQRTNVNALDLSGPAAVGYQMRGLLGDERKHNGVQASHEAGGLKFHGQCTSSTSAREPEELFAATITTKSEMQGKCKMCVRLRGLVPQAASVVERLYDDMFIALKDRIPDRREDMESLRARRLIPGSDLYQSWVWVLDRLNASVQVAKELLTSRHGFREANQSGVVPYDETRGNKSPEDLIRARWDKGDKLDGRHYKGSPLDSIGPAPPGPERRKSYAGEIVPNYMQTLPFAASSWSASHLGQPGCPMQAQASARQLPSPSSVNCSSVSQLPPPRSPSLPGPQSPHTAHLQELQHQLSTKSLAHQILQGEHDKLLAAYSRSQMRCATLEKKSHVSDTEINSLAEDRARLTMDVDRLELQVDELQQKRDEADKQSAASGAQYMKIMAMSSKLQAQSAADLKKWKSEREAWQIERAALHSKLAGRAAQDDGSSDAMDCSGAAMSAALPSQPIIATEEPKSLTKSEDCPHSGCCQGLREEIVQLRQRCHEAHASLEGWRADRVDLQDLSSKLVALGERMHSRGGDPASGMGMADSSPASSMGIRITRLGTKSASSE